MWLPKDDSCSTMEDLYSSELMPSMIFTDLRDTFMEHLRCNMPAEIDTPPDIWYIPFHDLHMLLLLGKDFTYTCRYFRNFRYEYFPDLSGFYVVKRLSVRTKRNIESCDGAGYLLYWVAFILELLHSIYQSKIIDRWNMFLFILTSI